MKEGTQLAMEDPITVFQVSHVDELPLTARYIVYSPPAKIQYGECLQLCNGRVAKQTRGKRSYIRHMQGL